MRTFANVPARTNDTRVLSRIGKMIDAALDVKNQEKRWPKKRVSPSMFPICPIQETAKLIYQKHNKCMTGESGTLLNIFAKAGTGMHESIQNALGHSGQMVGHWKCTNEKCIEYPKTKGKTVDGKYKKGKYTRTRSTNNRCPSCDQPMAYAELKVLYKSLKGYVDGLIDNLDGTYSLIDLKSTMVTKAADGSFFVKYHRFQIATYAYLLKKRYGYNIVDYTLVYVPRDNPKKFVEKTFVFDESEAKRAKDFMMTQIRAWDAAVKSAKTGDLLPAIKRKPCKSAEYYWDEFHGYDTCPFVDYCFIQSHMIDFMKKLEQRIMANPDLTYTEIISTGRKTQQQGLLPDKQKKSQRPKHIVKTFEL